MPMREGLWDNGTDGSPSRIRRPSSGPSQKRSCTSNIPDGSKSDGYFCLTRSEQVILLKLCTGHNKRNAHLFNKLETGQSEMCSCDTTPVITERLLQHCPFHDGLRRAAWPENRPLREKLYGDLVEPKRTAAFVTAKGVDVKEATIDEGEEVDEVL